MTSMTVPLAVVNMSTVLDRDEVRKYVAAQQQQITKHFYPKWGIDARMSMPSNLESTVKNAWVLMLLDDSDQADAMGYHYETPEGMPLSKVFVRQELRKDLNWTITASHEALEMLANPWIDRTVITTGPSGRGARIWAYEVCDPVEAEGYAYAVNSTAMSDFVYPDWFQPQTWGVGPWDHMHMCPGPLTLTPGGYASVLDLQPNGQPQWHPIFGQVNGREAQRHTLKESPRRQRLYTALTDSLPVHIATREYTT